MAPSSQQSTKSTRAKGSTDIKVKKLKDASQKTQKKPPPTDTERLKRLFTSLCAQIDGAHFANAIKTCDKILRIAPRDPDALQTKMFLLLQTEQYMPALSLIDSLTLQGDVSSSNYEFEKAYSLYRVHREADATGVLEEIKNRDGNENRGVMHLEAQLAYREGGYQTAFDLYNTLLDTAEPHSDEHADILTNLSASQAHLDFLTSGFLSALSSLPPTLADTLQSAPPPAAAPASIFSTTVAPAHVLEKPIHQKKPRARRIPPGVTPGVTPQPDPERWLKKSERSSTMHGKRRARGGATQGAMELPTGIANAQGSGGGKAKKGRK
ncbi:hypothetical protein POSPLADRAFT_1145059 [Postia placenta MAD-698-R-SB12]|uniref:Uncharacterized protein n=1 Tax=Postia placenta MAD-698-R-SB12 TaxID=670580 RepID=A0A1X6MYY1_9APHY|nr:hypothetical protein POSPLADRAFT_1145059 [Postia placenta MAD-698-R-SB12]OSX61426.1 hypothetical protein POSPLADRAFT_1145059 [Postia placenta MAD-698-R-SB12]